MCDFGIKKYLKMCRVVGNLHTPINADKKNFLNLMEATDISLLSFFMYK